MDAPTNGEAAWLLPLDPNQAVAAVHAVRLFS
jgi:hypothetical protein